MNEKERQVIAQCSAVEHLASAIALVFREKAQLFSHVGVGSLTEVVGEQTAALMEILGDALNEMDAVTEDDKWIEPVFAEAQRLWPQRRDEASGVTK